VVVTGNFKTANTYRSYQDDLGGDPTHNPLVHSVIIDPVSRLAGDNNKILAVQQGGDISREAHRHEGALRGGMYSGTGQRVISTFDPAQARIDESLGVGAYQMRGKRIATMQDGNAQLRPPNDSKSQSPHPLPATDPLHHPSAVPQHQSPILSPFDVTVDATRRGNTAVQQSSSSPARYVSSPGDAYSHAGDQPETRPSGHLDPSLGLPIRSAPYPLELLGATYSPPAPPPATTSPPATASTSPHNVSDDRHYSPFLANLWQDERFKKSEPQYQYPQEHRRYQPDDEQSSAPVSWRGGSVGSVTDARTGAQRVVYDARASSIDAPHRINAHHTRAPQVASSIGTIGDAHHQRRALDALAKGRRVFVAGPGGGVQSLN
jgi:hypothetical protein